MAGFAELNLDQGTDFSTIISLTDDTYGMPIVLSGYNVSSQMRKSPYSQNATANLICTISDATNGVITLSMNNQTTSNITGGKYVFDVRLITSNGSITRALEGFITVDPSVSR